MFLHKTNILLRWIFRKYIWKIPSQQPVIYLTFDDGPIPLQTNFVLDTLEEYNCKATFFVIGKNVLENQAVFERIIVDEHSFGNHTMNHFNGWKVDFQSYIQNVEACNKVIPVTNLFRPPYGRITRKQAKEVLKTQKIIMWDVLSGDYSAELSPERILDMCIKHTEPGSIVLFHDSVKAWKNLQYVLPKYIAYFKERGFSFQAIPM
jgi:peptidoglycan-N-acetylglucosamine deacetylase